MNTTAAAPSPALPATAQAWLTPLELGVLGAIWGASFLFMRVAAGDFGALALVEVRLALGSLVLLPFLWRARAQFPPRRWLWLAPIGLINSALPFVLFAYAAEQAPAAIGAMPFLEFSNSGEPLAHDLSGLPAPLATAAQAASPQRLLQQPVLSATHLAFVSGGDVWVASRGGGKAVRLTTGTGIEQAPSFSPDGQKAISDYKIGGASLFFPNATK